MITEVSDQRDALTIKTLPDYAALASSLMGAGTRTSKPGEEPATDLADQRVREDTGRKNSL